MSFNIYTKSGQLLAQDVDYRTSEIYRDWLGDQITIKDSEEDKLSKAEESLTFVLFACIVAIGAITLAILTN